MIKEATDDMDISPRMMIIIFLVLLCYEITVVYPDEKDRADSWLQGEISCYLAVSVVACSYRSIAPGQPGDKEYD